MSNKKKSAPSAPSRGLSARILATTFAGIAGVMTALPVLIAALHLYPMGGALLIGLVLAIRSVIRACRH